MVKYNLTKDTFAGFFQDIPIEEKEHQYILDTIINIVEAGDGSPETELQTLKDIYELLRDKLSSDDIFFDYVIGWGVRPREECVRPIFMSLMLTTCYLIEKLKGITAEPTCHDDFYWHKTEYDYEKCGGQFDTDKSCLIFTPSEFTFFCIEKDHRVQLGDENQPEDFRPSLKRIWDLIY